jgi:predicted DCC family thiol-disulfide oxidoreductase YuxK
MKNDPIILFDGVCNFCNGTVNFILRQDKQELLKFTPLQSPAAQRILREHQLPAQNFNSFVLIENGKSYQASTAALRLLNYLPWYWKWMKLFWIIPKFLRDAVYLIIAKNRYKWFGKKEACMIPLPHWRTRFLMD